MADVKSIATRSRKEHLSSLNRQLEFLLELGPRPKEPIDAFTPPAFKEAAKILYRTGRPQSEIAALVQVSASTLYRWAHGDRLPPRPDSRIMFYGYMVEAMRTLVEKVKEDEEANA